MDIAIGSRQSVGDIIEGVGNSTEIAITDMVADKHIFLACFW
jgi:hypothetical protein